MILHQLPSMYINQSFTNVGRRTSHIRVGRNVRVNSNAGAVSLNS